MKIFFYKTTNLVNGKFYYGVHKGPLIDRIRPYFGSNRLVAAAVKKYGKQNFLREVLEIFETEEKAFAHESKIVTQEVIDDPMCYNLRKGGRGGFTWTQEQRQAWSNFAKGRKRPNHGAKVSAAMKGIPKSEEHKLALRKPKTMIPKICPKCGTEGKGANMSRYHFENCTGKRTKKAWGRLPKEQS